MRELASVAQTADPTPASVKAQVLRVVEAIGQSIAGVIARRAVAAAKVELAALDDRVLKDIGITRSEIGSLVRTGIRDRQCRGE